MHPIHESQKNSLTRWKVSKNKLFNKMYALDVSCTSNPFVEWCKTKHSEEHLQQFPETIGF